MKQFNLFLHISLVCNIFLFMEDYNGCRYLSKLATGLSTLYYLLKYCNSLDLIQRRGMWPILSITKWFLHIARFYHNCK